MSLKLEIALFFPVPCSEEENSIDCKMFSKLCVEEDGVMEGFRCSDNIWLSLMR